jgi:hypothetical protein
MTRGPRWRRLGLCPRCQQRVELRVNGTARVHVRCSNLTCLVPVRCEGSGHAVVKETGVVRQPDAGS